MKSTQFLLHVKCVGLHSPLNAIRKVSDKNEESKSIYDVSND